MELVRLITLMAFVNCFAWIAFWHWKAWPATKAVMWYVPLFASIPLAYCWLYIFKEMSEVMDGTTWGPRLVGFGVSTLIFAFMSWVFLGETPLTPKTAICLSLAGVILAVQVFVK